MDYLMFQRGLDAKELGRKLLGAAMYPSSVGADGDFVTVSMRKGDGDGED